MQIEWHQIELKYERLHVVDTQYRARVMTSLASDGQQRAVLVVDANPAASGQSYILIDGYVRVAALRRLGHDTVEAIVLPISEVEALLLAHRLDGQRGRSVLEEAWLLRELVEGHGRTQAMLGHELGRAKGWVSRRLALVRILPEEVQEAVRSGMIPPHGAMKYLVPLARANPTAVIDLVRRLGNEAITVRQLARLYTAWLSGDAEQRERILGEPRLFLKTMEEIERQEREERSAAVPAGVTGADEHARALLAQLRTIRAACRRACGHLDAGALGAGRVVLGDTRRAFAETRQAFATLAAGLTGEEESNAGSRHPFGNLTACA